MRVEDKKKLDHLAQEAVKLAAELVRVPSETPDSGAALELVANDLADAGFTCRRIDRAGVANLWARIGDSRPHLAFAGHTDVVPAGELGTWSVDPYAGIIEGGYLWGRGSVDMKSSIAAMTVVARAYACANNIPQGSISILITGDEEGEATDGTLAILDNMADSDIPDFCLLGEPTSSERFGDMIKVGRRGSLNARITAKGSAGHSAYPQKARNPLNPLLSLLNKLVQAQLDDGSKFFEQSTLALTSVDVGNPTTNVIPHTAQAALNIRFNDCHSSTSLRKWLQDQIEALDNKEAIEFELHTSCSGESFISSPNRYTELMLNTIKQVTGVEAEYSTSGGTSDARFIQHKCPVAEFGMIGAGMHQPDEKAEIFQIEALTRVYFSFLQNFFTSFAKTG